MKKLIILFLMFCLSLGLAYANSYHALVDISGTISDEKGPVSGVTVRVTYPDPNSNPNACIVIGPDESQMVDTTDSNGAYQLPTLEILHGGWCFVYLNISGAGYVSENYNLVIDPEPDDVSNVFIQKNEEITSVLKVNVYDLEGNEIDQGRVEIQGEQTQVLSGVAYLHPTTSPVSVTYIDESGLYNNYTDTVDVDLNSQNEHTFIIKKHANITTDVSSSLMEVNIGDAFLITAIFTNGDDLTATAIDSSATISFNSQCASVVDSETKQIGDLGGGHSTSISWDVVAQNADNLCTITVTPTGVDEDMGTQAYTTSGSVTIVVSDEYDVTITSPTGSLTRGDTTTISAEVRDVNGNIVHGATVTANLPNGTTVNLIENGNEYTYTFTIGWDDPLTWDLQVEATKDGNYGSDSQTYSINSVTLSIQITGPTQGETFNRGDTATIVALITYPDGSYVTSGTATFTDPNGNDLNLQYAGNGIWTTDYHVENNDPIGTWTIAINANDGNDNTGTNSVDVEISSDYTVNIISQFLQEYNRGDTVTITASVVDANNNPVSGATVTANDPNGNLITLTETATPGTYEIDYVIKDTDPTGTWTITVTAEKNGNSGSDSASVTISNTYNVYIKTPANGDVFSKGQIVRIRAHVEDVNSNNVSGATVTANDPNGNTIDLVDLGNGEYEVNYITRQTDPSGNWVITVNAEKDGNTGSDSITVSLENPADIQITSITTNLTNDPYANQGQYFEIHINITNNGEAVAKNVNVTLSSSLGSLINPTSVSVGDIQQNQVKTAVFTVRAASVSGTDTLTAVANGTDENSGEHVSATLTKDIEIQKQAGGDDGELELGGDLGSGITVSPSLIGKGMHATVTAVIVNDGEASVLNVGFSTLEIRENDCNGNDVTSLFSFTTIPQPIPEIQGGDSATIQFEIWSDSAESNNYVLCAVVSGTDENSGKTVYSDLGQATFELDSNGPFYSNEYVNPQSGVEYNQGATYTFYITWDDPHGVSNVIFEFDGTNYTPTQNGNEYSFTLNSLNAGTYSYRWYANDSFNNWNSTQQMTYVVNKKTTYNQSDPLNSLVHLAINGVESDFIGVYGTQTNVSGWKDASIPDGDLYLFRNGSLVNNPDVQTLDSGVYEYKLIFNNSQNYADAEIIRTLTINKQSTSVTLLLNGSDSDLTINQFQEVNITAIPNPAPAYVEIYLNNTLIANDTTNSLSVIRNDLHFGTYEVRAVFVETNNYAQSEATHTLTVLDVEPPHVQLTSPAGGPLQNIVAISGPSVIISANASDDYEISVVEFMWNNSSTNSQWIQMNLVNGNLSDGVWEANLDSTALADGEYTIRVRAIDKAGNINTTSLNVLIDNTPPDITIITPTQGAVVYTGSDVNIRVQANDSGVGIADGTICNVYLDNALVKNLTYNGTTNLCTGTISSNAVGTHDITIVISDMLNNSGNATVSIEVTNPPAGGGGGGGGAPTGAKVVLEIDEEEIKMNSDETQFVDVSILNDGTQYLAGLEITVDGLPTYAYELSKTTIDLEPGEEATITLKLVPVYLASGEYDVKVEARNVIAGDSDSFTLIVTNLIEQKAIEVCGNASAYIDELEANGTNVTSLRKDYDDAQALIEDNNYEDAISKCQAILSFSPSQPSTPTTPPPGATGITGLFIAAGEFVMSNAVWFAVGGAAALSAFLGRRKILKLFKKEKKQEMQQQITNYQQESEPKENTEKGFEKNDNF